MRIFRRQKEPSTFPKSNGEAQWDIYSATGQPINVTR